MKTQSFMYGLIGLVIGALLTGFVMANQNKQETEPAAMMTHENTQVKSSTSMSMEDMMTGLNGKTGDEFDKTFMTEMILHHQGAIDMAKVAQQNAKHAEIKNLANDIISAQNKEITEMKDWQKSWGYTQ